MRRLLIILTLILLPILVRAETDSTPPEIQKIFGNKPALATGNFTWLGFKLYEGKIWAKGTNCSYNEPFALNLTYARDIDADDLVDNSISEMKRIKGLSDGKVEKYKKYLEKVFPNVKEGDTITAIYFPKQKVAFYHNSQLSGEVKDPEFGPDFLDIWLSPKTKAKELQQKIAGTK